MLTLGTEKELMPGKQMLHRLKLASGRSAGFWIKGTLVQSPICTMTVISMQEAHQGLPAR